VTGLFGGPRRSELCQLLCTEMDVETRQIEIKGIKAKTRQRRIITIHDLLLEWLAFTGFPDS
jgi:integrase